MVQTQPLLSGTFLQVIKRHREQKKLNWAVQTENQRTGFCLDKLITEAERMQIQCR